MSRQTYSSWINGMTLPSEDNLPQLCIFLELTDEATRALYPPNHPIRSSSTSPNRRINSLQTEIASLKFELMQTSAKLDKLFTLLGVDDPSFDPPQEDV